MNPLQSDVLRIAARLNLGFLISDVTGKLPVYPIVQQIPILFLWMELWKPRILFPHETVNWTVESLKDKGYLNVQPQMFFLPSGVCAHRTLNGTDWIIEAVERDEILRSANSERIATIPGGKTLVFACPREFLDRFRTVRKDDEDKNFVNFFTPIGLGCNGRGHPHFSLTDAGRENANLTAEDLSYVNSISSRDGKENSSANAPSLDKEAIDVLCDLRDHAPRLLTLVEMEAATSISRKTIGDRVEFLIGYGLAIRPGKKRKGATITDEGRKLADRLRPQTTH